MMRSIMAALRSLVLPYGATSGQRIVLDGTTGLILIYDLNNKLRIRIGPVAPGVELLSGDASESIAALLQALPTDDIAPGRQLDLVLASPTFAGRAQATLGLLSESFDGTAQPIINMAANDLILNGVSMGRGSVVPPFDAPTNDATSAAGVNTDMTLTFTADATRLYEVTLKSRFDVGTLN